MLGTVLRGTDDCVRCPAQKSRLSSPRASGSSALLLTFDSETRHRYSLIPPAQLDDNIGSLWGTTADFDTQDFSLVQLYIDHGSFADGLRLRTLY